MPSTPRSHAVPPPLPTRLGWPLGLWAAGLLASFWPTWTSGFALVQGGLGDSRLVNFILEHSYRWLMGMPLAQDLWSPPIFFPVPRIGFYTDLMLGVAPLYWPWRWLGAEPHTAYQFWMLSCWSLNFLAAYLLLRRGIAMSQPAAAAGAYLFAYASPRLANIVHQQLNPQFFLLLSLGACLALVRTGGGEARPTRCWPWIAALYGGLVLQLATAVYPLIFLGLTGLVALLATLADSHGRRTLATALCRHRWPLVVGGLIAIMLAAPLLTGYWETAITRSTQELSPSKLPRLMSWLLPGPLNLAYGWVHRLPALDWAELPPHHNGVGVVTLIVSAAGLWWGRRRAVVRLTVLAVAALFLLTVRMPNDWSLWHWVREMMPGAAALRGVGRVGSTLLYPAALGVALLVERISPRGRWAVVAVLAVVAAEQLHRPLVFDKVAAADRVTSIAATLPPTATAFLMVGQPDTCCIHDDAAWVAFASGVPTVNGRSGVKPRLWSLSNVWIDDAEDEERVRTRLAYWCRKKKLDRRGVAWITAPPPLPPS